MTRILQRSADGVSGWTDITGTTDVSSYVQQAADAGQYLRVKDTAGDGVAYSAVFGPVGSFDRPTVTFAGKGSLTATVSVTGGGGTPAAYPSILKTSGQDIVDANGHVMGLMRGVNIQPGSTSANWSAQDYLDIKAKGFQLLRVMVFWDDIEGTQGVISSANISALDTCINRAEAAGLYVVFCFYYGPNGVHKPTWVPDSTLGSYTLNNNGQNATQYLAKRYGDASDPLGAGQYSKAVIGFGINEPTPDSSSNGYLATHLAEQKTMMTWFRAYAPNWIGLISCGYGGGCPLPNVSGSGQTSQTFTGAVNDPFAGMGNWVMDVHCYKEATTSSATNPVYDGRNAFGMPNGGVQLDVSANNYPPSGVTRTQCQQFFGAYFASHKLYCGPTRANVPFFLGEWGWEPQTHTGGDNCAVDVNAAALAAGATVQMQWDYNKSYSGDAWACRPGSGAAGAASDGWQTATDAWLAS